MFKKFTLREKLLLISALLIIININVDLVYF